MREPSRIVPGGGVDIAVYEDGPDDAPPIVVAHGVASSPTFIRESFLPAATEAGFRLVTYDLRGHGNSTPVTDPAGHALALHVVDLAMVVDAVAARHVAGVSLGAHALGMYLSGSSGIAAAAICFPAWLGSAHRGEGVHALIAERVRSEGVPAMIEAMERDTDMLPWLRETLVRDWRSHPPESVAGALLSLDGGLAPDADDLALVSTPTVVVGWPDDPGHPFEAAQAWAAALPHGRMVELALTDMVPSRRALGDAAIGWMRPD